eukprot:7217223-Prymnesium_polylepis.2
MRAPALRAPDQAADAEDAVVLGHIVHAVEVQPVAKPCRDARGLREARLRAALQEAQEAGQDGDHLARQYCSPSGIRCNRGDQTGRVGQHPEAQCSEDARILRVPLHGRAQRWQRRHVGPGVLGARLRVAARRAEQQASLLARRGAFSVQHREYHTSKKNVEV